MAKSVKQLQAEFDKVSQETQKAYDVLHPTFGSDARQIAYEYEKAVKDGDKKTIKELKPVYDAAQAKYKEAQTRKNALRKELKAAQEAEQSTKEKSAAKKSGTTLYDKALKDLAVAEAALSGYQGEQKYIDAYRKAEAAFKTLTDSGVTPKVTLPAAKIAIPEIETGAETGTGKEGTVKEPSPTEFVALITDPKNKQLLIDVQKDLAKNFGYTGPVDGSPSADFMPSLQRAYDKRGALPAAWQGTDFRSFLSNPGVGGVGAAGAGGTAAPTAWTTIASESQAANAINQIFNSELNRDATPKEIKSLYKELVKAQAANPTKQKIVNGVRQTISGLDAAQWIKEKAQALPEYAKKKSAAQDLVTADISETAMLNGIKLSPAQLKTYSDRIKNGEDIKTINNEIRTIASVGQPEAIKKLMAAGTNLDTVYAPYKQAMSTSLGINEDTITLDDPTLRMAIGPEKEMSLYDFRKAIRQDNRWKYSQEANNEVDAMISQVKQDFGFMG